MNKSELVKAIAERTGKSQADAAGAFDATIDVITETLKKGDSIAVAGFGTFAPKRREAREGRNPATGQTQTFPARTVAQFKPASALKNL